MKPPVDAAVDKDSAPGSPIDWSVFAGTPSTQTPGSPESPLLSPESPDLDWTSLLERRRGCSSAGTTTPPAVELPLVASLPLSQGSGDGWGSQLRPAVAGAADAAAGAVAAAATPPRRRGAGVVVAAEAALASVAAFPPRPRPADAPAAPPSAAALAAQRAGARAAEALRRPKLTSVAVRNSIAVFHLGQEVNIKDLAASLPNVMYRDPSEQNLRVSKIGPPKWTALVQKSGAALFYAQLDGEDLRLAAKTLARLIQQRCCPGVTFKRYRVSNVVVMAKVEFQVDLEGLIEDVTSEGHEQGFQLLHRGPGKVTLAAPIHVEDLPAVQVRVSASGALLAVKSRGLAHALPALESLVPLLARHGQHW